jgi:ElaB/YqjD/DUF883 family membrane-anchored ribosome-binding protein
MPKELLGELETTDSLLENLKKILDDRLRENADKIEQIFERMKEWADDSLREIAIKIGQFFERMKGTALAFENAWRKIVANVAKGQTAEMQAEREQLLNEFEKRLKVLKMGYAHLTREHKRDQTQLDPDFLLSEIAGMERLKSRVFDHWQSAEDLEDLAARDYPLTTAELDKIGPQRRPPDSWYAEEGKPF